MDLSLFCSPSSLSNDLYNDTECIGSEVFFAKGCLSDEELSKFDIAIISVDEDRGAIGNKGTGQNPDDLKHEFYSLTQAFASYRLADFGTISKGKTLNDTLFALKQVTADLLKAKKNIIVLGGGQHLSLALYQAYAMLQQSVNIASIDRAFDIGNYESELSSNSYISKIILDQPNYLFNYSCVGYQSYFVSQKEFELMHKLYFDAMRLGEIRADIKEVEPVLRNADFVSFDFSAIKNSDGSGTGNSTPNGLYSEEICQLSRYIGLSDKNTVFGAFEYNAAFDKSKQSAKLLAQILWYYCDGFYGRKNDYPQKDSPQYLRYIIPVEDMSDQIVFYKSLKTDRWWMDLPALRGNVLKFSRHKLVPCSYADYQMACANEIPERWYRALNKLI